MNKIITIIMTIIITITIIIHINESLLSPFLLSGSVSLSRVSGSVIFGVSFPLSLSITLTETFPEMPLKFANIIHFPGIAPVNLPFISIVPPPFTSHDGKIFISFLLKFLCILVDTY